MTSKNKFYITTAIDYVNSLPHLGTAYEKIGADVLARFLRMDGYEVHFQMGNDEHSANVQKEAEKLNLPPKVYCDEMREKFESIWKSLDISYDNFIQTSEPRHHLAVKAFLKIVNPQDIYKAPYEGWYCESCEAFYTEKDLPEKICPTHKKPAKWLKEENYFFRLSAFQERLLKYYEEHPNFIVPETRRNEVLSLVKTGLQDVSISRSTFTWGIPFSEGSPHVVYVWFDALLNYLTAIGFGQSDQEKKFDSWWKNNPNILHIVGKDITRFHCAIWPAMLMSACLPIPATVFGHGFVYLKGEKMSKSLGNVLTPLDIVPQYGSDALRYYLLRESSFGSDGDFTWDNFIKRYNSDLANDLGNLLNRTLGMTNKYTAGKITAAAEHPLAQDLKNKITSAIDQIRKEMDYKKQGDINFHKALSLIWEIIAAGDKFIDTAAPWKLAKENKTDEIGQILYTLVDTLRNIAILVKPFIPGASQKIWEQLGLEKSKWSTLQFNDIAWAKTPNTQVTLGQPIFPRIDTTVGAPLAAPHNQDASQKKGAASIAPTEKKMENTAEPISIDDFMKVDLRIAEIKQAEKIEGADRLLKLQVDLGTETRQIVAGIALHYKPEELIGKKITIVANLKPAKIRGVESHGMLLAASDATGLSVLTLDRATIATGSKAK